MGFHRLTVPTYYGGLPGSYDYINNAIAGTPAPADVAKGSGVNAGTYFIAFGEDATSSNSNRANAALAENCDIIDDTLRGSQVVMRYVDGVVAGVPTTEIALVGDVYVGGSAETPAVVNNQETRNRLVRIVDADGNDLVSSGSKIVPAQIDDGVFNNQVGVPADGFFTDPTVRLSAALGVGVAYRLYYLTRRHLTDIVTNKPGEFFAEQIRTAGEGASVYSLNAFADLYLHGLDDVYRRASAYDATPPASWPGDPPTADTAGNGAWFVKDSWPLVGYNTASGTNVSGSLNEQDYHLGATFAAQLDSSFVFSLDTERSSAGSGFVALGRRRTAQNDPVAGDPALFGFFHGTRRDVGDSANTDDATVLEAGDTFSLAGDQLTLGGGWFYKNLGGVDRSSFVKHSDIIVMQEVLTGDYHYVVVTEFTSPTVATIRYVDGGQPNLTGDFSFISWISPMMFSSEDAASYHQDATSALDTAIFLNGFMWAEPPKVRYTDSAPQFRGSVRFFAGDENRSDLVSWGGYRDTDPLTGSGATWSENGRLFSDGGAYFGGTVQLQAPFGSSSALEDAVPLLRTQVVPVAFKLMWERATGTSGVLARLYTTAGGDTIFTNNAGWDGSDWLRDGIGIEPASVTIGSDGKITREWAAAGAAGSVIAAWTSTQNVTKFTLEHLSITTSTPAWSNATTGWTTVTGVTKAVTVAVGDIVKIKCEGSFEKTGSTNGAALRITQGGSEIADSVRFLGTLDQIHAVSLSTQFEITSAGSLTFELEGRLLSASGDSVATVASSMASIQIEVLRPEA